MNELHNDTMPLLSVCMVTYNQENWISNAIDGVLLQETTFSIELVIADDCSTDETLKVVEEYQRKYPKLIKIIKNPKNLGLDGNFSNALNHCSGKYIAICEGDDYWTFNQKLQTQFDYMQSNPDIVLTSHNNSKLFVETNTLSSKYKHHKDFRFDQNYLLHDWVTQPVTCVFRNVIKDYVSLYRDGIFCDVILFYELLKHGDGFFFKDDWAIFRVSKNALSSGLNEFKWSDNHIIMFDNLLKYNKEDSRLKKLISNYHLILIVYSLKNKKNGNITFTQACKHYFSNESDISNLFKTLFLRLPYYFIKY